MVAVTRHELAAGLQAIMVGKRIKWGDKIVALRKVQHLNLYLGPARTPTVADVDPG
jgi:hypothetical protein